jgi:hypothetical protein
MECYEGFVDGGVTGDNASCRIVVGNAATEAQHRKRCDYQQ